MADSVPAAWSRILAPPASGVQPDEEGDIYASDCALGLRAKEIEGHGSQHRNSDTKQGAGHSAYAGKSGKDCEERPNSMSLKIIPGRVRSETCARQDARRSALDLRNSAAAARAIIAAATAKRKKSRKRRDR